MNDPHVERLRYKIGSGEGITFGKPPSLEFANKFGKFALRDGELTVKPSDHYANESDARVVIDPFLRSWEIQADLSSNVGAIRFTFMRADVIDRNPPPPGSAQIIRPKPVIATFAMGHPTVLVTQNSYPSPPSGFRTTAEVELAYSRWIAYRQGREPLPSMAYLVLTVIEAAAGGRKQAAKSFRVDEKVLATMGRLASTKGGPSMVRKVSTAAPLQPLSAAESTWLEGAVRAMIRRLGEHASGTALREITLADLPSL